MQTQISTGYISDEDRVEAEMQVTFEDLVQLIKEMPGGNGENPGTGGATVLASDAFAVVDNYQHYALDGQGGVADDLKNITGTIRDGAVIYLRAFSAGRPITIKNAAGGEGQIYTTTGRDYLMSATNQYVALIARGAAFYMLSSEQALIVDRLLGVRDQSSLTVASGTCTPDRCLHGLTTGGTAQNLDNIAQTALTEDGSVLILTGVAPTTAGNVVTLRHNQGDTGQIYLKTGSTFVLDTWLKGIMLRKSGAAWYEVIRWGDRPSELPALGSPLQQLRVNAGGTALEYFTASSGGAFTAVSKSANFNVTDPARTRYVIDTTGGAVTMTFNGASPADNTSEWEIYIIGSNKVTITAYAAGSEKIKTPLGDFDSVEIDPASYRRVNLLAVSGGIAI